MTDETAREAAAQYWESAPKYDDTKTTREWAMKDFEAGAAWAEERGFKRGLEAAAQRCEREAKGLDNYGMERIGHVARSCATGIRALADGERK